MTTKLTPMMAQWAECKQQAGDALLLFRLGDFYEAFEEDATTLSKLLDLTLTKRQETPMCGIPWHTSEGYIDRLLAKGFSVAVAEQVSSDQNGKALMERKILRILTPATAMQGSTLKEFANSLFLSLSHVGKTYGAALVDVTTGLFQVFEKNDIEAFTNELLCLSPKELLCSQALAKDPVIKRLIDDLNICLTIGKTWTFEQKNAENALNRHFGILSLDGLGLNTLSAALSAAGALLTHLKETLLVNIDHLTSIENIGQKNQMLINRATYTNLNIFDREPSLFSLLNQTSTPMGARLLRSWMLAPLTDCNEIRKRQETIKTFLDFHTQSTESSSTLKTLLEQIRDLERLIARIQTGNCGPRDVRALALSTSYIDPIRNTLPSSYSVDFSDLKPLVSHILQTLVDEPPLRLSEGQTICSGVNSELDELRAVKKNGSEWLSEYQTQLREELGIKTLKVGYSRTFGYYIEVSRLQSEKVPSSFIRRQTLTNNERYISEKLKAYEEKVLTAEKRIEQIETAIFDELKAYVIQHAEIVVKSARAIAQIDLFFTLARIAHTNKYICPKISSEPILEITGGRHPILERENATFIPNDLSTDARNKSMLLITGPNMAGKSTYVRQAALLVFMAQIGSFIPADEATIGIVDQIFSRIGANDDLARGQSTFMVEMSETAAILRQATPRSLILLDEIGRGTSTYDGISIAWAVVEYLLRLKEHNPRTLFATHYFELTDLAQKYTNIENLTVAISEQHHTIQFLYKIIRGTTDRSYGIHVAQLAGIPQEVIKRAQSVLLQLEDKQPTFVQPDLFSLTPKANPKEKACYEFLKDLNLVQMTPMDCFQKLISFQETIKSGQEQPAPY